MLDVRTAAAAAASSAGTSLLQLVVPGDFAGRLIGRKGANVQELQSRTGARVQFSDLGQEQLVEVSGACPCVDAACSLLVADLARIQKLQIAGCKLGLRTPEVEICALIPEDLRAWAERELFLEDHEAGEAPEAAETDVAEIAAAAAEAATKAGSLTAPLLMELLGFAEVSGERFRRLRLVGKPSSAAKALQRVRQRLRRHSRWAGAKVKEPTWRLEEGDDELEAGFVSTDNFVLGIPLDVAEQLKSGPHAQLLSQIKEDSGAAARVSSKPGESASVEIAGSYWSKMRALLEISAVVMQMQAESPKLGLCLREEKLSVEEAVEAAKPFTPDARAGARRAGRFVLELVGPAAPVCGAAMAVCRESERKALALERKQGPPGLLVDYLARWFGRDAGRMLRERQAGHLKRGVPFAAESDMKRPKTAELVATVQAVQGPEPAPEVEVQMAAVKAAEDPKESSEEEELPAAGALLEGFEALPAKESESEESPAAEAPAPPDSPSSASEAPPPAEPLLPAQATAPHAEALPESDSDSDYYPPGPAEDPLWARRQAILKKIAMS